jgi:hypothetical protein
VVCVCFYVVYGVCVCVCVCGVRVCMVCVCMVCVCMVCVCVCVLPCPFQLQFHSTDTQTAELN